MHLTTEAKKEIFKKFGGTDTNTGSAEAQIALFTERITHLTSHLKQHRQDFNTERSLVNLVGKRKRLLAYLRNKDIERYRAILKQLDLRK